jgi:hypothetical protein
MTTDAADKSVAKPTGQSVPDPRLVEEPVAVETAPLPPRHRARSITATVLGILAVLVLTIGIAAVWAKVTVLRSDRVAELVNDAIAQPEVQQALATYLADSAATAANLESALRNALPDTLDRFAPSIAAGAESAVERVLARVLGSEQAQQIVTTVVEQAHAKAMNLLRGDGLPGGINVENGEVSINTLPLLTQALTALQSATGLFNDVEIPQLSASGDPAEQEAELEAAFGRDLPDGFGQLVVYQSDTVAKAQESVQNAQRLFVIAKRALLAVIILSVVLIGATILVAPRRARAVLVLALGTTAAMVTLRSAVRAVVNQAPDLTHRPGAKAAIRAILGGASESLLRLSGVVLLVSIVTVLVVLLLRRWRRDDLVLVAAVMLGALTTAAVGVGSWGLIAGLVVGIAVPFVMRWLWPGRAAPPPPAAPEPAEAIVTPAGAT